MKSLNIAAFLLLSTTSITFAQDITIQRSSSASIYDLGRYATYTWAQEDATPQEQGYEVYGYTQDVDTTNYDEEVIPNQYSYPYTIVIPATDLTLNTAIQKSITKEIEEIGYVNDDMNPHLLASYKVIEHKAKLRTRNASANSEDNFTDLEPGTLIISFTDSNTGQGVWDGVATGLVKGNTFTNDSKLVQDAIHLIFQEFKFKTNSNRLSASK
jgi:hypothetical protein